MYYRSKVGLETKSHSTQNMRLEEQGNMETVSREKTWGAQRSQKSFTVIRFHIAAHTYSIDRDIIIGLQI